MVDLDDPRTSKIAESLGSDSCKKILEALSDKDMSETDLSEKLGMPLNTVGYNLNKLVDSGLVEKAKEFFWSVKGRKIKMYTLSNKKIVISPKTMAKGVVPAIVAAALGVVGLRMFYSESYLGGTAMQRTSDLAEPVVKAAGDVGEAFPMAAGAAEAVSGSTSVIASQPWLWFGVGAVCAIVVFTLWQRFRK